MKLKDPLKQILTGTRDYWDTELFRPWVRENFRGMIDCRTPALGGEIYKSNNETKLVCYTCKRKGCPSCGHRSTLLWQRQQWRSMPDIPYVDMVLTMPSTLWPVFCENRHLLHDLPRIGAAVVQEWVRARHGVKVFIMVVPHTFGRKLNFNSHQHMLVSAGGLHEQTCRWVKNLDFDKSKLMHMWRYAVITYLREALRLGLIQSKHSPKHFKSILTKQYERWWNIHISRFKTKGYFLRYAGRYLRRPPIAQHRFHRVDENVVEFWRKDLKSRKWVITRYSPREFVDLLANHLHDRYRHGVRHFGLSSPMLNNRTSVLLFVILGQTKQSRCARLSWRMSLLKYFGVDPLIDAKGETMKWAGRIRPGDCRDPVIISRN